MRPADAVVANDRPSWQAGVGSARGRATYRRGRRGIPLRGAV